MMLFWAWLTIVTMLVYMVLINYYNVVEEREHKKIVNKYKKLMSLYEMEIDELERLV